MSYAQCLTCDRQFSITHDMLNADAIWSSGGETFFVKQSGGCRLDGGFNVHVVSSTSLAEAIKRMDKLEADAKYVKDRLKKKAV